MRKQIGLIDAERDYAPGIVTARASWAAMFGLSDRKLRLSPSLSLFGNLNRRLEWSFQGAKEI
jgi:hypothetical protein